MLERIAAPVLVFIVLLAEHVVVLSLLTSPQAVGGKPLNCPQDHRTVTMTSERFDA